MQSQTGAIVSKLLTGVSNGYVPTGYIAEQVLPPIQVAQTTGKIGKYTNNHLRIVNTVHQGKGPYRQLESVTVSSDTYSIEDHGLHDIVTENDMRNYELPFDAERDTAMALTVALALGKEYALASSLTNPSVITNGTTLSGTAQYNNLEHADAQPLQDKLAADAAIESATGLPSNTAIMSPKVFRALRFNRQLLKFLGYTEMRPNGLNAQELANALEVDRVLVGSAQYNTAKEGQSDSMAYVWGSDLIYARIEAPGLMQKTLGFEVRKSGTSPRQVYRFNPTMPVNSRGVIVTDNYDQLILNPTAAYLIQDAIA